MVHDRAALQTKFFPSARKFRRMVVLINLYALYQCGSTPARAIPTTFGKELAVVQC
jgi:hypothetical protein